MLRTSSLPLILCIILLGPAEVLPASDIDAVRGTVFAGSRAWQSGNTASYISFRSPASGIIVKSIKVEKGEEEEKAFLDLNNFSIPLVFSLEGSNPRIVIDIRNVSFWNGHSTIPVNGRFIKQIRTHLHRHCQKLRIVLDLRPSQDYIINQTYDKGTNIYCLQVKSSP